MIEVAPPYISYFPSRLRSNPFLDIQLYMIVNWAFIALSSLAIMNRLPLYPFNEERFLYFLAKKITKIDEEIRIFF